ncbi:TadE/TadG family type IV pilus assembly protein [Nocardioides lacusdianchii]|uniref:TadE/TadG family type IV pilus assembly protein n=1 Tax=Nocardioides lacusdianchii TaxID=2783664 RepID=UPI001CCC438F|nr:TadE/TadG family type IV pilus assembly protein [Nocardioides lacusdianchii]
MRWRTGKITRGERGASAVEFALVMPILLLMLVGIINFGLLFGQNLALSNAARQAARYAVVQGNSCDAVKGQAVSAASPLVSMTTANVTVSRPGLASCSGATTEACKSSNVNLTDNVTVTLTYTAQVPVGSFVPGLGSTKVLTGKGVFRCEFR